jgi:hypothetical protein
MTTPKFRDVEDYGEERVAAMYEAVQAAQLGRAYEADRGMSDPAHPFETFEQWSNRVQEENVLMLVNRDELKKDVAGYPEARAFAAAGGAVCDEDTGRSLFSDAYTPSGTEVDRVFNREKGIWETDVPTFRGEHLRDVPQAERFAAYKAEKTVTEYKARQGSGVK